MKMRKLAIAAVAGLGLAGCDVSVTSNDADTRNTLNAVEQGASDLRNQAEVVGRDIGNEFGRAADAAGNGLDKARDRIDNVSVDVDLEGNASKGN